MRRLKQRFRQTGSLAPRVGERGPVFKLAARLEELRQAVQERPDATPAEHQQRLRLPVSRVTVWRMLRRLGLTRKKKSTHAAERERPERVAAWSTCRRIAPTSTPSRRPSRNSKRDSVVGRPERFRKSTRAYLASSVASSRRNAATTFAIVVMDPLLRPELCSSVLTGLVRVSSLIRSWSR